MTSGHGKKKPSTGNRALEAAQAELEAATTNSEIKAAKAKIAKVKNGK